MNKREAHQEKEDNFIEGSLNRLARTFKRTHDLPPLQRAFDRLKKNAKLAEQQKYEGMIYEEKERRIIAEASLTALQVELKEALDKIKFLEKKDKKRKSRKERKKNRPVENSRSLTIEDTPTKEVADFANMENGIMEKEIVRTGMSNTKEKLEDIIEGNIQARRSAFPPDQRGSVNTEMRHRRLQNRLLTNRGSVAASSVYSLARTEFSFHPSINQSSKWKLKYNDHHNHKKMWSRMHGEDEKIKRKLRMKSHQKETEEMFHCTFTPEIFTRKDNENNDQKRHKPAEVKQLSLRLYQYADLFKEKKESLKEKFESERGQEMRFTPKLSSGRSSKMLKTVKERNYASDITLLSVKKPGENINKRRSKYYDSLGSSAKKSPSKGKKIKEHSKGFSTTIYSQSRKPAEE